MRDVEQEYGCYRCGTVRPIVETHKSTGEVRCGNCGEAGIVTLRQSLDIVNDYYIRHKKDCIGASEADEFYLPDEAFDEKD